ncbi:MAG: hypothetical protein KAU95_00445 [Candidatus Aenigmarchaeota archaeon]|nr:hypothetical protein [Candidatus Aenigmarchaeota archaeon]
MVEIKPETIKKLRESKRKFAQSFDLIINVSSLDLKKPENRIRERMKLPYNIRKAKICFIVDSIFSLAKETKQKVMTKSDLDFGKKEGKSLAKTYDFFVVEAPLMPIVAKSISKYIGPRNKTLIPVPPTIKTLSSIISDLEKTVSLNLVKNPVIQIKIGGEELSDEQIIKNFNHCFEKINSLVEKRKGIISSVYLKLTMGKPLKVL